MTDAEIREIAKKTWLENQQPHDPLRTEPYWSPYDRHSVKLIEQALRSVAEKVAREIAHEVRESTLEEVANLIKEPCPYYPKPCGDCRHCNLTKAAIRILALKKKPDTDLTLVEWFRKQEKGQKG